MSDLNDNPAPPRPRKKRRSYALLILAAGMLAFGVAAGTLYYVLRPVTLRIAVGPPGSEDQKMVQLMAQTFARDGSAVRLSPITTEGAAESIALFAAGKSDLAVARGDLSLPANAESVAILRKNVVVLWSTPAMPGKNGKKQSTPKIKSLNQLVGHKVGVIGRTQANVTLLRVILTESGINPDKVTVSQFATNQIAEMAKDPTIDAFMAVGPLNSKITADAIAASTRDGGTPKFLAIDLADAIAQNHPAYEASEIPAGTFGAAPDKPEDEVKTISFSHHIVARKSVSESTIAAFTRQLFAIRQTLKTEFPLAAKIETPDTDKDAAIPAHPGAAAFVDGEEKTFLDRYSDFIWWGLMGLSAMGSAGAWFAGHLKKDERSINTSQRDRLLDMLTAARSCDSMDELDRMQSEADAILRDTLQCFEHGAIEEGSLTAFNFAIEQFHNAVADRKSLLMHMPQNLQRASAQFRAAGIA